MDESDRMLCALVQRDGRMSNAELGSALAVPTSTANDRLRRLQKAGVIKGWHAALDPQRVGAGTACFVLIDMDYAGEAEAVRMICSRAEVMELHHVSGAHSYLAKLRVAHLDAVQTFLAEVVKPLPAVRRTETLLALTTLKETSAVAVAGLADSAGQ